MLSSHSFVDRIAVILLAAGLSTRARPRNKLLVAAPGDDPDRPMVRRSAEILLASRAQSVMVVTGHEPTKVRAALNGLNVTFVHNPDYGDGMAGSLAAGVSALPDHVSGVLIALGDMPKLQITTVNALIEMFDDAEGRSICIPVQEGRRGNPVLFGRAHFPSLSVLMGDHGGKTVVRANPDAVAEVVVADPGIHLDFDNP